MQTACCPPGTFLSTPGYTRNCCIICWQKLLSNNISQHKLSHYSTMGQNILLVAQMQKVPSLIPGQDTSALFQTLQANVGTQPQTRLQQLSSNSSFIDH